MSDHNVIERAIIERDWHGCYSEGWQNEIVSAAYSHPAKFSRGLIRRIYAHTIEQGWIKAGDTVLDPFGGVALGGLDATRFGLNWVGIELEVRFVELGRENIALWEFRGRGQQYNDNLPTPGKAILLQGDSRYLAQVLGEAGGVVSSPPFLAQSGGTNVTAKDGPLSDERLLNRHSAGNAATDAYGDDASNLGNMPEGEFDAAIGSPPYAESLSSDDPDKRGGLFKDPKRREDCTLTAEYGSTEGQLGAMRAREFDTVVSSPPFEKSIYIPNNDFVVIDSRPERRGTKTEKLTYRERQKGRDYGSSLGQLGTETGQDFWSAAALIMQQTYSVLSPGAVAIWVLKAFVRNKQIVDFPDQWRQLGESCGFETIEIIHAWLTEERGAQYTLFGGIKEKRVERKSFFRRLAEAKAQATKFWEQVDRSDRAKYLWTAHNILWQDYHDRLDEEFPPYPTRSRITSAAQTVAWVRADKPEMDIETRIDYEIVLVQRKAL